MKEMNAQKWGRKIRSLVINSLRTKSRIAEEITSYSKKQELLNLTHKWLHTIPSIWADSSVFDKGKSGFVSMVLITVMLSDKYPQLARIILQSSKTNSRLPINNN